MINFYWIIILVRNNFFCVELFNFGVFIYCGSYFEFNIDYKIVLCFLVFFMGRYI